MHTSLLPGLREAAAALLTAGLTLPLVAQDCPPGVAVDGGEIALANGATEVNIVVDGTGDPLAVAVAGTVAGANQDWVITDADLRILGLPEAPPFDLDAAGPGTCLIWYLSSEDGLMGLEVDANAGDLAGCFDLSNAITVERTAAGEVNAGDIALLGGGVDTVTCVDGIAEAIGVATDGTATGETFAWVITDADLEILGLPEAPPFDLDPAGPGTCLLWYLAYDGEIEGATRGANAADLAGDFDLSNPITVVRQAPDAGAIALASGATETSIVIDGTGDPLDVVLDSTGLAGDEAFWVVTDEDLEILGLFPPGTTPRFDFDGAGTGTCLIWYLSSFGGVEQSTSNVSGILGCYDLSNAITVQRLAPDAVNGGNISLRGGAVDTFTCVDGLVDGIEVERELASGETTAWVITDTDLQILGLPAAPPFDLDAAGPGTCLIWGIAYDGEIEGATEGANAADLAGDFDLSNPITVVRQAPDGGTVTIAGGATDTTVTAGAARVPVASATTADALDYAYVITDDTGAVLGTAPATADTLDLSGAPAGTCRIYGYSYGPAGAPPAAGTDVASLTGGCQAVSAAFVTVVREESSAVRDLGDLADVRVYPNPADGRLTVAVGEGLPDDRLEIRLVGADGHALLGEVLAGRSVRADLDVAALPAGVYLVHLVSGGAATVRRVVKR